MQLLAAFVPSAKQEGRVEHARSEDLSANYQEGLLAASAPLEQAGM